MQKEAKKREKAKIVNDLEIKRAKIVQQITMKVLAKVDKQLNTMKEECFS